MSGQTAVEALAAAWKDRADALVREAAAMTEAPALFKMERVQSAFWEHSAAVDHYHYWTGIGAA